MCLLCKLDGIPYHCPKCGAEVEHHIYHGVDSCPKCNKIVTPEDRSMITLAPRPREGSFICAVYDALLDLRNSSDDPEAEEHSAVGIFHRIGGSLSLDGVRSALYHGKAWGYFTDSTLLKRRYYKIATLAQYEQRQTFMGHQTNRAPGLYLNQKAAEQPKFNMFEKIVIGLSCLAIATGVGLYAFF